MLDKHEQFARDAKAQGAQVICFQELFYGPYFGITEDAKYYDYAEPADGPIVQRFAALAARARHGDGPADLRGGAARRLLQHRGGGGRRRHDPRQVPQAPHPQPRQVLGEVLLPPRQPRLPGVPDRGRPVGVYICYDRHFPEGWRELGLNGAQIVFNPNATKPGLSNRLWEIEQPAAAVGERLLRRCAQPGRPRGQRVRRPGRRPSTAPASSSTRRATSSARWAAPSTRRCVIRDLDLDMIRRCATTGSSTATAARSRTRRSRSHDEVTSAITMTHAP